MWTASVRFSDNLKRQHIFAIADDEQAADGREILSFRQALEAARDWCHKTEKFCLYAPYRHIGPRTELIICPIGSIYTVGHAVKEFLEWKRVHGAWQSFQSVLSVANRFIVPVLAHKPVANLTPQDFYDLMHYVERTPKHPVLRRKGRMIDPETLDAEARRARRVSANNTCVILRGALNRAWEEGKVDDDRAWRRVKLYRGVQKPRVDMLTREECCRLIEACRPDFRLLVLGALYTGCRVTELLNMRAEDLSRERMAIYVKPIKVYRPRFVTLPEEGYRFFCTLVEGKRRDCLLFLQASGQPWCRNVHCEQLHEAMEQAHLPKTFVFHSLRHTYASLRLQEGVAPLAVARQLGHKGTRTVMEVYAHCADDFIDREIRERFQPLTSREQGLLPQFHISPSPDRAGKRPNLFVV